MTGWGPAIAAGSTDNRGSRNSVSAATTNRAADLSNQWTAVRPYTECADSWVERGKLVNDAEPKHSTPGQSVFVARAVAFGSLGGSLTINGY
jgi:hypothetical protein